MSATQTYSGRHSDWSTPGAPAYRIWVCPTCHGEPVPHGDGNAVACETCGCRYDAETGAYLGGGGR